MALVGRRPRGAMGAIAAGKRWWRDDGHEPSVLAVGDDGDAGDERFRSLGCRPPEPEVPGHPRVTASTAAEGDYRRGA